MSQSREQLITAVNRVKVPRDVKQVNWFDNQGGTVTKLRPCMGRSFFIFYENNLEVLT